MSDIHHDYAIRLLQAMFAVASVDNKITGRERSTIYNIATSDPIGLQRSAVTRELKQLVARVRRSGRQETIHEIVEQFSRLLPTDHDEDQFMDWLEQVAVADGDKEAGELQVMKQLQQTQDNPPVETTVSGGLLGTLQVAANAPLAHQPNRSTSSPAFPSHFSRPPSRSTRKRSVNRQESSRAKRSHALSILGGSITGFLACTYGLFVVWHEGKEAESWLPIEALVTAREMRQSRRNSYRNEREMDMAWETHVQYTVNGNTYNRVFNKYSARKTMTIYYNPTNPAQSSVTQGVEGFFVFVLVLVIVLSVVGILIGAVLAFWPHLMTDHY